MPRQGANETKAQRINLDIEAITVMEGLGVSPLELVKWPTVLVEGFQVCDIVERQRSPTKGRDLPVEVGDASQLVSPAGSP
jgi:hypothetical protein